MSVDGNVKRWNAADLEAAWLAGVRRNARRWFGKNAREMPWRADPQPYRVWVSEIMLQQTQVVTVIPYFERFMARFPDVAALAAADEQDVLRLWEGLGYYRRARMLHQAARQIVERHDARFPDSFAEVLALPGVGRYTAGAIMSIGWDQPYPILEGNTVRLFSRLTGFDQSTTDAAGQDYLWGVATRLVNHVRPGELNQGLMEIGSEVCRPRDPNCFNCPLKSQCAAFTHGNQLELPKPKNQPKYEDVLETAFVVSDAERYLVRQCPEGDRWAGLWDFPRFAVERDHSKTKLQQRLQESLGIEVELGRKLLEIKHAVTRFRITLECFEATPASQARLPEGSLWSWRTPRQLTDLPLSVTGRRIHQELIAK